MKEFVQSPYARSISDDGDYIAACIEAARSYAAFVNFKRDPRYTKILEHASVEQGHTYLRIIEEQTPNLLEKIHLFKVNDIEGGSRLHDYPLVGKISPSTLRYLKVVSDIQNLFFQENYVNIAEIGIGYGGQLLLLDQVISFRNYYLFDLYPVLDLAKRYLEGHILNNSYRLSTINQTSSDIDFDLVISNYAFSELPLRLQEKYVKKVLQRSARGYLTMNSGLPTSAFKTGHFSLKQLESILPSFEILPEVPLTHPGNYLIVWGHKKKQAL